MNAQIFDDDGNTLEIMWSGSVNDASVGIFLGNGKRPGDTDYESMDIEVPLHELLAAIFSVAKERKLFMAMMQEEK